MRKLIAVIAVALLSVPMVFAQASAQSTTEARLGASAGISGDSALYGLDRAMERIQLALSFGADAKANTRLKIAEERLAEAEAMARAAEEAEARAESSNSTSEEQSEASADSEEKQRIATEAREDYESNVQAAVNAAANADAETRTRVEERLQVHIDVLQDLRTRFQADGIAGSIGIDVALGSTESAKEQNNGASAEGGAEADVDVGNGSASVGANASGGFNV